MTTIVSVAQGGTGANSIASARTALGVSPSAAYDQANAAYAQANAAYTQANTKLDSSGGTISGNLTVSGDLFVEGNTVSLNVSTLEIEDNDIILNANTTSTPTLNATITVDRGSSTNTFLRWNEATDKWGWSDDGSALYNFSTSLDAYAQANSAYGQANNSYAQANAAYGAANNTVLKAGDTMTGTLNISNSTAFITTGNVGIGTTNPGAKVQIDGNSDTSDEDCMLRIIDRDTTSGSQIPTIQFLGGSSANLIGAFRLNDQLGFQFRNNTNSTVVTFNQNGNVGIATTNPGYKLDVDGNARFRAGSLFLGLADTASAHINAYELMTFNIDSDNDDSDTRYFAWYKNGEDGSGTELMRLTEAGNLGIGVTPSASASADCKQIALGGLNYISGTNGTSGKQNFHTGLLYNAYQTGASGWNAIVSNSGSDYLPAAYTMLGGQHQWRVASSATAGNAITFTQAMTLDASGRLGIGETSPSQQVHAKTSSTTYYFAETTGTGTSSGFRMKGGASADYTLFTTQGTNQFAIYDNAAGAERLRLDSAGNLGIGTSSPASAAGYTALVLNGSTGGWLRLWSGGTAVGSIFANTTDGLNLETVTSTPVILKTNSTERARITSGGLVGINMSSPSNAQLVVKSATAYTANTYFAARFQAANYNDIGGYTTMLGFGVEASTWSKGAIGYTRNGAYDTGYLAFYVNGSINSDMVVLADEKVRITAAGNFLVQKTTSNNTDTGINWIPNDYLVVTNNATDSGDRVLMVNRQNSDGTLVEFRQANINEGTISVSGSTVSYNGGHLSRWSQFSDGSHPDLVKGTVMTNLDQMAVWINPETGEPEENEQLNCMKVSDVEGDPNVAGVFVNWDGESDLNIAMTGDMIIRIAQGVVVQRGDLLMSAGDGTAKPQGDDIIRSKTIAKVTSTHVTCTYEDGSYCVPCVLMAC